MDNLPLNFRSIINMKDPKDKKDFFASMIMNDHFLYNFNPDRYNFYLKFVSGLSDPEKLEQFYYKETKINDNAREVNNIISKITSKIKLLGKNGKKELIKHIKKVFEIDTVIFADKKIEDNLEKVINSETDTYYNKKVGGAYNSEKLPEYEHPISDLNKKIESNINKQTFDEITQNPLIVNKKLEVNMQDRIVFIILTFVFRMISLFIIEWSLNANVINNFYYALVGYCCFYILLFLFFIFLVNVLLFYPITELYSDYSIVYFSNIFYYLYIYYDGFYRILVHIAILCLLLFIPYTLDINSIEQDVKYDYVKKQEILTNISNFSFVIWILTSLVALRY